MLAFQLFDPTSDDYEMLQELIREVENMVLDKEQIRAGMGLYDIEMALESNLDYYSYFEKSDGRTISKFDVERELNKIKAWIYERVQSMAVGRKFQRFR